MTEPVQDTLIVNLFGGPGVGKSTIAVGIQYRLKVRGIESEYISEFAKDKVWQEDWTTLRFQPYVTCKQAFRQSRLRGQVAVAVTDSPIPTGLVHQGWGCPKSFEPFVMDLFGQFHNLNIVVDRGARLYSGNGRKETEAEAVIKHMQIIDLLDNHNIQYTRLDFGHASLDVLVGIVLGMLEYRIPLQKEPIA